MGSQIGHDDLDGLPIGLQLIGRPSSEATLLQVAVVIEVNTLSLSFFHAVVDKLLNNMLFIDCQAGESRESHTTSKIKLKIMLHVSVIKCAKYFNPFEVGVKQQCLITCMLIDLVGCTDRRSYAPHSDDNQRCCTIFSYNILPQKPDSRPSIIATFELCCLESFVTETGYSDLLTSSALI